uniref:Uncharacterized protein n=1 Tax=Triatoma infestans TaxID=30076 RepID=A0A170UFA3_TRIIF
MHIKSTLLSLFRKLCDINVPRMYANLMPAEV